MADYSEFPTTPTAWQERQLEEWQTIAPLSTEDTPAPQERRVDLGALIPGVLFIALAVVVMAGVDVSFGFWEDGGVVWLLLIGGGIALLVSELKKARRRRG